MVHYIRFLRTPQVTATNKKRVDISGVIAVTTDLGDAYYSQSLELTARLYENHPGGSDLQVQPMTWKEGSRALKFTVSYTGSISTKPVVLHVAAIDRVHVSGVSTFVDVISEPFQLIHGQRTEPVVERKLSLPYNKSYIHIWEETGDSIARHIWDASLGFLIHFNNALQTNSSKPSVIGELLKTKRSRRLRVLELGAGCGIVGIALAQLIKCEVLLTDLEDATEILERNVEYATPAQGSLVRTQVLDWATPLDDSSFNFKFDLVLVSDCIYNPDSSRLLVEVLNQLAQRAAHITIMLGFKRRHEADTIFFDTMKQTQFRAVETSEIQLPHATTDHDVETPTVEFYIYRLNEP